MDDVDRYDVQSIPSTAHVIKQAAYHPRNWIKGCIFVGTNSSTSDTPLMISKDERRLRIDHKSLASPKEFTFFRVFDMSSDLSEFYSASARDVVDSVLHGIDGSVIFCGQVRKIIQINDKY
jgi:hypothetical protein